MIVSVLFALALFVGAGARERRARRTLDEARLMELAADATFADAAAAYTLAEQIMLDANAKVQEFVA